MVFLNTSTALVGEDIKVQRDIEIRLKMVSDHTLRGIRAFPPFWTGAEMSVIQIFKTRLGQEVGEVSQSSLERSPQGQTWCDCKGRI